MAYLAPVSSLSIGGAEIAAYAADHQVALIVGGDNELRLVDLSNPALAKQLTSVSLDNSAQSVAVFGDLVAVAKSATQKTDNGKVEFFRLTGSGGSASLTSLGSVDVGALPDSIAFNGDGTKLVVANEGEPNTFFEATPLSESDDSDSVDPQGSISIIEVNFDDPEDSTVETLFFSNELLEDLGFGVGDDDQIAALREDGIRISVGTPLVDFEPEYTSVLGNKAYVTLQENNAIAVVNLDTNTIESIRSLGEKDWNGTAIDTNDKDGGYEPTVKADESGVLVGLRLADAVASFTIGADTYYITANEGDGRVRPDDLNFEALADATYSVGLNSGGANLVDTIEDPVTGQDIYIYQGAGIGTSFDFDADEGDEFFVSLKYGAVADDDFYSDELRASKLDAPAGNAVLDEGRLKTVVDQNTETKIVGFGARSFTIYNEDGDVVFDSGSDLEEQAYKLGVYNDSRSDDKGTEPEGVATAEINGRIYAFIALERATSSTVLQYDITDPSETFFVQALRNPNAISAEGVETFEANGKTYAMVSNEVSGTLDIYDIQNKTIGSTTALIPEAGSAVNAEWTNDGESGNTDFPYGKFKALATVGEIDPTTGKALTGYPDGNAAWLHDENTIRVAYQSESYGPMSSETYGSTMNSGVTFTGSKVHYIDYDRAKFADFLDSNLAASDMVKGSGELFEDVYNVFGELVVSKNTDANDLAAKWGNQTLPDGTLVEFKEDMRLNEADFFFQSFCGAWYETANKYGDGIGFADNAWLMAEEWNIGYDMFDGGADQANETMGLASMVVDVANKVAYTVPVLGQTGFEKILPINPGHENYVVLVMSGYNHDQEPVPNRIYVGVKDKMADGSAIDYSTASDRDRFLARNGLLYGKTYGLALDAATYSTLGIVADKNKDGTYNDKVVDDYLKNSKAPDNFSGRFYSTSYQWGGFDNPVAVKDTEMFLWEQAGEQPEGYTFFNGDSKLEHSAVDPDTSKVRFVQNMTDEGGILGFDLTSTIAAELDAAGGDLPEYLSVDVTRVLPAVNGALTLKTGGEGLAHAGTKNLDGTATAASHLEAGVSKAVANDGLHWVKNASGDYLIVDEDSGNDYGERKYAIPINSEDLTLREDSTGYLLAIGGGSLSPRAAAEASALGDAFSRATSAEFSGSWNVTGLVARKDDGTFYSMEDLAGTGEQEIISSLSQADQKYIGVIQMPGESGGQVEGLKADQGGQLFMFDMKLPILDDVDQHQGLDKSFILDFASTELDTVHVTAEASRSAKDDTTVGFYKVIDVNGTVLDHITGNNIAVGESGYKAAALQQQNRLSESLSRADGKSSNDDLVFTGIDSGYVAMFATNETSGHTYFSFTDANADGYNHFKYLGSNKVGVEDVYGGGDRDHNDLIVYFSDFA